jgi:hypothetical protein
MGAVESYRANGEGPGVEGLDKLYPGEQKQGGGAQAWRGGWDGMFVKVEQQEESWREGGKGNFGEF